MFFYLFFFFFLLVVGHRTFLINWITPPWFLIPITERLDRPQTFWEIWDCKNSLGITREARIKKSKKKS